MQPQNNIRGIPSLDGIRAVSITFVILGHAYNTVPYKTALTDALFSVVGNGHLGVLIFFVISGYLITYLLKKELERSETISLKKFYFRRTLRIFPAFYSYIVTLSLLVVAGLLTIPKGFLLSAALYVWNYSGLWLSGSEDGSWFLGHFWSLALEEQFYLLWPITLLLAGKRRAGMIATLIILCMPPVRVISYALWPGARGTLTMMFHTAIDPLMVGCILALWEGATKFEAVVKHLFKLRLPLISTVFCLFISPILSHLFRGAYNITIGMTVEGLSAGLVMLWLIRHADSKVGKAFNNPRITYVGILSYSIYLWQQLFLTPFNSTFLGIFPLNIIACFMAALVSYHLIESPALKFRQWCERRLWPQAEQISLSVEERVYNLATDEPALVTE